MRVIVQRVSHASVSWVDDGGHLHRQAISRGLAILVGAGPTDNEQEAERLADKVAQLRIFPDQAGRFNVSLEDIAGEALVV